MTNIHTLTDIQTQEENSVQSITLRNNPAENVSTQTSITDVPNHSNLNETLREVARRRLETGNDNLPLRPSVNGVEVMDSDEFRHMNSNLDVETRRNILQNIVDDRYENDMMRTIVSNLSPETTASLRNALTGPMINPEVYTPFLNILIYGNIEINDFNVAIANLSNLLVEMEVHPEPVSNVEETISDIEERTNAVNEENRNRAETAESRRNNILTSFNWRTIMTRGATLAVMGIATYMGSPQLGSLANIGVRMLENYRDVASGSDTNLRITEGAGNISWRDVSEQFWNSWALFARYMSRKD